MTESPLVFFKVCVLNWTLLCSDRREALAASWACEKFTDYILGAKFRIENDHKPIVPRLSTTHLHNLPSRVLYFWLQLNCFDCNICRVPSKNLCSADTLFRAPAAEPVPDNIAFQNELKTYMHIISSSLPASSPHLYKYCNKQKENSACSYIHNYCEIEWPGVEDVPSNLKPYSEVCSDM